MTTDSPQTVPEHPALRVLRRKNVLAGLMFIGIAALGLFLSRNYPIGTAVRMGTGYIPRLLCWTLMGLGAIVLLQGWREADPAPRSDLSPWARLWPVLVVTASMTAFALSIERLGLVVAILFLTAIGALAARGLKAWETLAAAAVLITIAWAIFILGLGLPIPVWPDW
jgi:hypothetical protein